MPATAGKRPSLRVLGQRARRGVDPWLIARVGIVAIFAYLSWEAIVAFGRPYVFFDMNIYQGAVAWWAGGGELYEFIAPGTTLGFTYPPFAAVLMAPMVLFTPAVAGWVNVVGSLLALAVVLAVLLIPIADRYGWPRWFAVALALPVATATEPVRETLGYGQINLLLFALILADLLALRWRARGGSQRGRHPGLLGGTWPRRFFFSGAWAGVGVGLAAAIKLTPALFILYFVVTRQWRAAVTAVGTTIGVTIASFVVAGHESATYFGSVLWHTERVGAADMTPNQSLAGLLARLYDSAETPGLMWLAFGLLLLAVGLSRATSAHKDGDELTAFTLVGLTANVISPISWSHHLVFVIPAVVVLADAALRRRGASRGLAARGLSANVAAAQGLAVGPGLGGLRSPIWFPALTGLRHTVAGLSLLVLFVVSPIWPYEHRLPEVSHWADGLVGMLAENSLAIALIVLVAALPWRPGAEPAFYTDRGVAIAARRRARAARAQAVGRVRGN